ncbi:MAG: bifunctional oligoribonuclease/PAP phosphatase NrnA [bacterium]
MIYIHKQINDRLKSADKVIIVTHKNPDGDALGSAAALSGYLKEEKKTASIFCASPMPAMYDFLHHLENYTTDPSVFEDEDIDLIVVLDSGDLEHAGISGIIDEHRASIINIDHHPTNKLFGHINLVDHNASSTAEIIFKFLNFNRARFGRKTATALLTGIITDTGNFTNSATTISAINSAGALLRQGANLRVINKAGNRNNSLDMLKLWGVVLNRLEHHEPTGVTYTYLTQKDFLKHNITHEEADGVANFMNNIDNIKIGLFVKEIEDGKIKGSLRTTRDDVDVSKIAKLLNGGGHKKAAGFTIDGEIKLAIEKILTMV